MGREGTGVDALVPGQRCYLGMRTVRAPGHPAACQHHWHLMRGVEGEGEDDGDGNSSSFQPFFSSLILTMIMKRMAVIIMRTMTRMVVAVRMMMMIMVVVAF